MTAPMNTLENLMVLVVGDVMLDRYQWGSAARISPEAPVPVVRLESEETRLGGAANVAHNLATLGAKPLLAGVVGADAAGAELKAKCQALGINVEGVFALPQRATTEKIRLMAQRQMLARLDREEMTPLDEAQTDAFWKLLEPLLGQVSGVIVSDYGKGLLGEALLQRLIATARQQNKPVVVDPKGTDYQRYRGASCVTPNAKEAAQATGMATDTAAGAQSAVQALQQSLQLDHGCVTLGERGVVGYSPQSTPALQVFAADAREVFDVTGAGDTFIAVLGGFLAAGRPFWQAVEMANRAAGVVVGKMGTATISSAELQFAGQSNPPIHLLGAGPERKAQLQELEELGVRLKANQQRLVFTNGCFDLLHLGHIRYLADSRAMGDVLVVGLNSDASVRRLKGATRPVIDENDRAHLLAALAVVDHVVVFEDDTPLALIEALKPDVLTKGADYTVEQVVGHELLQQWGGEVRLIELTEARSTSALIEKIAASGPKEA